MNRREFVKLGPAFPVAAVTATLTLKEEGKAPVDLDVSILKLQDGDHVVLSCPGHLSMDAAERIKAYWEQFLPNTKAFILADGMKIDGVLRGTSELDLRHHDSK